MVSVQIDELLAKYSAGERYMLLKWAICHANLDPLADAKILAQLEGDKERYERGKENGSFGD